MRACGSAAIARTYPNPRASTCYYYKRNRLRCQAKTDCFHASCSDSFLNDLESETNGVYYFSVNVTFRGVISTLLARGECEMNGNEITELFFERSQKAIELCRRRFGVNCRALALRILGSLSDAEEAENDAYLAAWNSIPPNRPRDIEAYLYSLTRRASIDMLRARTRIKRGGDQRALALDELKECVPSPVTVESEFDRVVLREALESFIVGLPEKTRLIFLKRYWWMLSAKRIAAELGMSESAVRMQLKRTREKLKEHLKKEVYADE